MRKLPLIFISLFAVLCYSSCDKCCGPDEGYPPPPVEIRIGALLSATGSGSSTGESSLTSLKLAQQDINSWFASTGRYYALTIQVADTRTDTAEALKQLRLFYDHGIRMVIGPYSSAEVAAIKPYADSRGILIVSPSSVAVSLAIPNDNIFRFVSSDVIQGRAMTQMLVEDGMKVIVPLIRNDVWGNDLLGATTSDFTGRGGVVATAARYDPKATDFSDQMAEADSRVSALLGTYAASEIAVYLCSFEEGAAILSSAGSFPNLDAVSWYGSSAFAQNGQLPANNTAAGFALSHKLPCPIFGLDEADREKWQPLKMRIEGTTGHNPDAYALTAYDAAWVGMKSYLAAGLSPTISALKTEFVHQAEIYDGVTGNTTLDVNGDRAVGNYDFWGIKQQSSAFSWVVVARYNSATGVLTRYVQ